jgi:glycosyltransferase involved in cell wall biosynthesis
LRFLVVHNYYGSENPSGENAAVDVEIDLLRQRGHEVEVFARRSDTIRKRGVLGAVYGGLVTPWNPWAAKEITRSVLRLRPDIVHVHNTFPLISAAIFSAIGRRAARVLTLHNYRLFCAAAFLMRDGQPCTECIQHATAWPAVRYGCYRHSRVATLPLAAQTALHRKLGTWRHEVEAFIVFSEFQRGKVISAGLPPGKVHVRPNFQGGSPQVVPWAQRNDTVTYVGRLTPEKGAKYLLHAWLGWGDEAPELRVVGDGPLRTQLESLVRGPRDARVRFVGSVTPERALAEIALAKLLVVPSTCIEGFPLVLKEAFALGTPVAVSNVGPLPAIVRDGVNGVVFESASDTSLLRNVRYLWNDPQRLELMGRGARATFEKEYTEEIAYARLMKIYETAASGLTGFC